MESVLNPGINVQIDSVEGAAQSSEAALPSFVICGSTRGPS
jgi:hypothetical protein